MIQDILKLYPEFDIINGPYFDRTQGRNYINLRKSGTILQVRLNISKALMEIKLNRKLSTDETVDHIDEDKSNDAITNLQVLTRANNTSKSRQANPPEMIELVCYCGIKFKVTIGRYRYKKKTYKSITCSRRCAARAKRSSTREACKAG
jgi:hypothetical protein